MSFDADDWLGITVWTGLFYTSGMVGGFILSPWTSSKRKDYYDYVTRDVACLPPGWVYWIVWFAIFGCNAVGTFLFWQLDLPANLIWVSGMSLAFCMAVLTGISGTMLTGFRSPIAALIATLLTFSVSVTVCVLFFELSLVAGGLIVPMGVWFGFDVGVKSTIVALNRGGCCYNPRGDTDEYSYMFQRREDRKATKRRLLSESGRSANAKPAIFRTKQSL